MDDRISKLADILVNHSTRVQKGEIVEINGGTEAKDLILEVARLVILKGAYPRLSIGLEGFAYMYYKNASEEQLKHLSDIRLFEAEHTDVSISIGAEYNTKELSNIRPEKISLRRKALKPVSDIYMRKNRWVICEFPTNALAQDAEMSLGEFEDFAYSACIKDWSKEEKRQDALKKVLDKGKNVHVIGKDTDLKFSIDGRTANKCYGRRNMPDGEVFIAPVETTAEGHIHYDYPVIYSGKEIENIRLEFSKGLVVKATAGKNQDLLRKMIKIDPGASRIGEFGIGTNFGIKKFIKEILFDEKIGGTIHLALGMAYKEGGGKNESALHWDMIKDLRKGGKVLIDGKVLEENGVFKIPM